MNDSVAPNSNPMMRQAVDISIKLLAISLFLVWSFRILSPFINLIVWAAVIAVAVYPVFLKVSGWLGGRRKLALVFLVLLALAVILVPTWVMANSLLESVHSLGQKVEAGTLDVPPPPARVKDWPLVGDRLHDVWQQASENLQGFVQRYEPQVKSLTATVLSGVAGAGVGILQLILAIVIAAILLLNSDACIAGVTRFTIRLAGESNGEKVIVLSTATVRSVAMGVLGVAFIQAVLATIGMMFAGIPAVGIWAFMVLLLAIVQLPPLLVLLPLAIWVFASADSQVTAWIFLVYSVLVSFSDALLKPLLLGRGVNVPMIVILLGAIGGMILSGIVGLFVGAVVLALGYRLLTTWLDMETEGAATEGAAIEPAE